MKLTRAESLASLTIAALIALASLGGAARALGAHPWWADQSGVFGAGLGLLAYLGARLLGARPKPLALVALLALLAAIAAAHFGKSVFVAASDFNATAGRAWYFGWITLTAAIAVLGTALFAMTRKPPHESPRS